MQQKEYPLHRAAYWGKAEVVQKLITAKANLDIQDEDGSTALYCAVYKDHAEVVQRLIEAKANLGIHNKLGWTAFHVAIFNAHIVVSKLLIATNRISLNAQTNNGYTTVDLVLYNHALSKKKKLYIISFLLKTGVKPNHPRALFTFLQSCNQADPGVLTTFKQFCAPQNQADDKPTYSEAESYLDKLINIHVLENSVPLPIDLLTIIMEYDDNPLYKQVLTIQDIKRLNEEIEAPRPSSPERPHPYEAKRNRDLLCHLRGPTLGVAIGVASLFITGFIAKDPLLSMPHDWGMCYLIIILLIESVITLNSTIGAVTCIQEAKEVFSAPRP
jgi:Ankyrin repeats (3 copies)